MKKTIILFAFWISLFQIVYANSDRAFTENIGQIKDVYGASANDVNFYLSTETMNVYLTNQGLKYIFDQSSAENPDDSLSLINVQQHVVDFKLQDINPNFQIERGKPTGFEIHYYTPEKTGGFTNIQHYETITYKNIYPKVDWIIYVYQEGIKYDFIVHPGGNPNDIKWSLNGASKYQLLPNGKLLIETPMGDIKEQKPTLYQNKEGKKHQVEGSFNLSGNELSFNIGTYDTEKDLIIDPYLTWATLYGNHSSIEYFNANTIDTDDNLLIVGRLNSIHSAFPTYNPGNGAYYFGGLSIDRDGLILKFDKDGKRLWATYFRMNILGGLINVATDSDNNIFAIGQAIYLSSTFSLVNPGGGAYFQPTSQGNSEAIVLKFSETGVLLWSTYFGGTSNDEVYAITIDLQDNLYVGGSGGGTNFPYKWQTGAYNDTISNGGLDMFIAKFNNHGVLLWSTLYGGTGTDQVSDFAINKDNELIVVGKSTSISTFPTFDPGGGAYFENCSGGCFVNTGGPVLIFDAAGVRRYASLVVARETINAVAVDTNNNIFLGTTFRTLAYASTNLQFVNPGNGAHFFQENFQTRQNIGYFVKLTDSLSMEWATFFGNTGNVSYYNEVYDIAVDKNQNLVATMYSAQIGATPLLNTGTGYFDGVYGRPSSLANGGEGVVVRFDNNGVLDWSTYYGGRGNEYLSSIAVNTSNEYLIAGRVEARGCFSAGVNPPTRRPLGNVAYYDGIGPTTGVPGRGDFFDGIIIRFSPTDLAGTDNDCTEDEVNGNLFPVELSSFNLKKVNSRSVKLYWETASELNNSHFVVEKSKDGADFERLTEIDGAGTTSSLQSYSYIDNNTSSGYNYYRLQQIDHDGTNQYSPIKVIEIEHLNQPNIIQNKDHLIIQNNSSNLNLQLINTTGIILKNIFIASSNHTLDISTLPKGVYFIYLSYDNQAMTKQFIKN